MILLLLYKFLCPYFACSGKEGSCCCVRSSCVHKQEGDTGGRRCVKPCMGHGDCIQDICKRPGQVLPGACGRGKNSLRYPSSKKWNTACREKKVFFLPAGTSNRPGKERTDRIWRSFFTDTGKTEHQRDGMFPFALLSADTCMQELADFSRRQQRSSEKKEEGKSA